VPGVINIALGNLLTLGVLSMVYLAYQLVASYVIVVLNALLLSEALRRPKDFLVRAAPRWMGHATVAPLLVFTIIAMGALLFLVFASLSLLDFSAVLHAARNYVSTNMDAETLQKLGLQRTLNSTLTDFTSRIERFEDEYNNTEWWPLVADAAEWVRTLETSSVLLEGEPPNVTSITSVVNGRAIMEQSRRLWAEAMERSSVFVNLLWQGVGSTSGVVEYASLAMGNAAKGFNLSLLVVGTLTSSIVSAVFFVTLTVALLAMEESFFHQLIGGLFGQEVENNVRLIVEGVFFYPVALSVGRFIYTVAAGLLLGVPSPCLVAFLTFIQTLIPVFSAYPVVAALPWLVALALNGRVLTAAFFLASQYFVLGRLEEYAAFRTFTEIPPWVAGLSIVLGFERFGLEAFIIGPLIISLVILGHSLLMDALNPSAATPVADVSAKPSMAKRRSLLPRKSVRETLQSVRFKLRSGSSFHLVSSLVDESGHEGEALRGRSEPTKTLGESDIDEDTNRSEGSEREVTFTSRRTNFPEE